MRLLIVMPSWVGDAVMATPALRLLRSRLRGAYIGGLVRPGIDAVLAGTDFFDELHIAHPTGVLGPKFAAARVRPRRYDAALLLTNSFSTALTARIAGIPRRVGYSRDGRGILLTDRLEAPRRADGRWAPIPAVSYYWHAARCLLGDDVPAQPHAALPDARMELATTEAERAAAAELLERAGIPAGAPIAILNPGGNNPAKRWPPERFAALADHLARAHGLRVLINGSPGEAELVGRIAALASTPTAQLPAMGITLGSLKAILAGSSRPCGIMVTNDTGPRHLAAAFGVPVVTLFGPTDHRWTTIPTLPGREAILVADPTLPETEVADDHPERCRIERIEAGEVLAAVDRMLAAAGGGSEGCRPVRTPEMGRGDGPVPP